MDTALAEFGIEPKSNLFAVHTPVQTPGNSDDDPFDAMVRIGMAFSINEFGDHPITRPLRSLQGLIIPALPVTTRSKEGITLTPELDDTEGFYLARLRR